eukprot:COSAG01_NODE_82815_length_103_cov_14.250000_1_plen_24_part_01
MPRTGLESVATLVCARPNLLGDGQ